MIWLSVNFDVFIKNLQRLWYEKILLLTSVNLWGDYHADKVTSPPRSIPSIPWGAYAYEASQRLCPQDID